ncbi:MAG: Uma2 family endonuclease [Hyphomicrobiaceae bacterium]
MTVSVTRPATYEDLVAVPDTLIAEILHGSLITHPRQAGKHAEAAVGLSSALAPPFREGRGGPGGWRILFEPELHLGPHVVVPDLAGWRRERMPQLPPTAFFALAPDWTCEVVSPSSRRYDHVVKRRIYAEFKVGFYWLAEPEACFLETYALQNGTWVMTGAFKDNDRVAAPPFAEVPFLLGQLWTD